MILFLHGSWVGPWYWHRYVELAHARGLEARALDFSERWRSGGRIEDLVADVGEAGDAVLVGHSFGALVAQHVAARRSARALVLMAPVSPRGAVDVPLRFQLRMARYFMPILLGRSFELRPRDARRLFLTGLAEDEVAACLARYTQGSGRAMREAMLRSRRLELSGPVLVVAGEQDPFAPPPIARRLARRLGADYLEAPGAGHTLMLGARWEETARRVLDWIEARSTR